MSPRVPPLRGLGGGDQKVWPPWLRRPGAAERACVRARSQKRGSSRRDRARVRAPDGGVRGPSLRRAARSAKAAGGGSALGLVAGWLGGPRGGGFARLGLLAGVFALAVEAVAAGVLAEVDELLGGRSGETRSVRRVV